MHRCLSINVLGTLALSFFPLTSVQAQYNPGLLREVNAAEAASLAQNNAFDLNIGIQDFTFQLFVVLTNLTEDAREKQARLTDAENRLFLQRHVIEPFEKVRDDLKTASEDLTRASLNFVAQTPVNNFIRQVNNITNLIAGKIDAPYYQDKSYYRVYRKDFLNPMAVREFYRIVYQFDLVIRLHKRAVAAAK